MSFCLPRQAVLTKTPRDLTKQKTPPTMPTETTPAASTSTPWVANGYDIRQSGGGRYIANTGPHHTPPSEYPTRCRLEDESNARLIVEAVNSRSSLLAENARLAAQVAQLRAHLSAGIAYEQKFAKADDCDVADWAIAARAALAATEEGGK